MPDLDSSLSPIFVVGTGRSGTTLLRMMLNAHPRIYLTHEASFYVAEVAARRLDGRAWLERYFESPSFLWLQLPPEEVRARVPEVLPRSEIRTAFNAIMQAGAARYGRPRFGDKTPSHSAFLKRIFADYPDARVIHVVRDPRATVASLLRMPWGASTPVLNNLYCRRQLAEVRPFLDRLLEVRLEDLIAEPEAQMRRILAHVGEDWDPAVLDHPTHAPLDDLPPFPWFAGAARKPSPRSGTPSWQRELSPAWIRRIEKTNRADMERLGYEPLPLDPEPTPAEVRAARRGWFRENWRCARKLHRLTKMLYQTPPPDPDEGLKLLLSLNPQAWERYPDFEIPPVPRVGA